MGERKFQMNETVMVACHADGTRTRVHFTLMKRGTPRRLRRTFVVGYGVDAEGIARRGGNCHDTLASAAFAFRVEVARKDKEG